MNHQKIKIIQEIISGSRAALESAGVTASLEEQQWLTLSSSFAHGHIHGLAIPRCAWELLERNGAIAGSAKIAMPPPENTTVQAIAEILIDSPDTLGTRIQQAIGDLAIATSDSLAADEGHSSAPDLPDLANLPDLKELTTAAGWDFHCRGDGRLTIALDVPGSSANAILSTDDAGEIQAVVELAVVSSDLSEDIRQAVGSFLLQLGGVVRLVRPGLCTIGGGEREVLQLQSPLGRSPTAIELNHALSALSVACRMGQREVALLLASESISQRYLSLRGWSVESAAAAEVTVATV